VLRSGIAPDGLRRALSAAGHDVRSLEPVVPSLEDVFLDVVDRLERGQAA
jgi:hypothetical protein